MNASELKYQVEIHNGETHFFDRDSMRFFGDTMRNYGVRETTITTNYDANDKYVESGIQLEVYELYRKHPVKHGLTASAYFDKQTFRRVYPAR